MTLIDLTNCDSEPIHVPGKIQEHGFLVAVNADLQITYCSENLSAYTPADAVSLLGTSVQFLETAILNMREGFIYDLIHLAQNADGFHPLNPYPVHIKEKAFNLIICPSDEQFLLEFEPAGSDLELDVQQVIGSTLSEILADANLGRLLHKTAGEIREDHPL